MGDVYRIAPATFREETAYGATAPGWNGQFDREAVDAWLADAREHDLERVCCLLEEASLDRYDDLLGRYREAFGDERVLHAPVPDRHLADADLLNGSVLPFLGAADEAGERAVVHCRAGVGRTGHVLAAWLAHARGRSPGEAVSLVEETGRTPREAVRADNATERQLTELLEAVAPE